MKGLSRERKWQMSGRDRNSRLPITGDLPIFGIRDGERTMLQLGHVPGRPDLRKTDVRETTSVASLDV